MFNKYSKKTFCTFVIAAGLLASTQAGATAYTFNIDNPPGSASAGDITNFSTSYQTGTEQLSFSSTIKRDNGNLAEGFWLVLSDGPNPKSHYNEYAIIYGDANTGNLSTYVYNGVNSSNSWNTPGEFIQSSVGGLNVDNSVADEVTFSFSIDASFINAYTPTTPGTNEWDGVKFNENIGIWYHPAIFSSAPTYNNDGSLSSFSVSRGGWYDTANRQASVSAPAMVLLMISGLMGMVVMKRRSI